MIKQKLEITFPDKPDNVPQQHIKHCLIRSQSVEEETSIRRWVIVTRQHYKGCAKKNLTILFLEFLDFLRLLKFHFGHFSTSLYLVKSTLRNLQITTGRSSWELTFCVFFNPALEQSWALRSSLDHSWAFGSIFGH